VEAKVCRDGRGRGEVAQGTGGGEQVAEAVGGRF